MHVSCKLSRNVWIKALLSYPAKAAHPARCGILSQSPISRE
jgi:hypothetical protein